MVRKISGLIAVLAAASGTTTLQAASVSYDGMGLRSNITVLFNGNFRDLRAGQMNVHVDGAAFVAYCVDLDQSIQKSWSADLVSPSTNPRWKSAAWLYDTFAAGVTTNTQAAALQVAIWEVVEDFSPLDLAANIFRLIGSESIRTQAQTYLNALPEDLSGYTPVAAIVRSGPNPQSQDIIIPEPGTLAVMLLGIPVVFRRRLFNVGGRMVS